ncbi:hypothetical protein JW796_04290 [Candidatus Dojkabacteria bacterium]|nr:hypothetical protein [Candidatus Dojkabacteria bacterium]
MNTKTKKIITKLAGNIGSLIGGATGGAVIGGLTGLYFWLPAQIDKLGFVEKFTVGIFYILAAVFLFGIIGFIAGGIAGIVFYQIGRILLKQKQNK